MVILKIGGGAAIKVASIVADLPSINEPYVIVHGANALRDQLAEKIGINRKVLTSLSGVDSVYSDENLIDLMMMSYAGLANKRLVSLCQKQGINAVGLSGLDGRVIEGKRNAGIKTRREGKNVIVRDFSGKPQTINEPLLRWLLDNSYVPVLCVPIVDQSGVALNSENDDIVTLLQKTFKAETVIHLIEAAGLLSDPNDPQSVVPRMTSSELSSAVENSTGRFKRKLLSISKLLDQQVTRVIIADGRIDNPVSRALKGEGTTISA